MAPFDVKKSLKALYAPTTTPTIIDVPPMTFIMVSGRGDPNTSQEYAHAIEILYGLSYSIKMSKITPDKPEGYFEYVVAPLEGQWWFEDDTFNGSVLDRKDDFFWNAMIYQPDFVTAEVFETAKATLATKKGLDSSPARLEVFTEGLCAQILHIGPYDDEPASLKVLEEFTTASGYRTDISGLRRHHEIYLGDPRKTAPEKLRTILRHPVAPTS